jgi:hypothetical protein
MQYQPPSHVGDAPHDTPTPLSSLALVALPFVAALLALAALSGDWLGPVVGVTVIVGVAWTAVRLRRRLDGLTFADPTR